MPADVITFKQSGKHDAARLATADLARSGLSVEQAGGAGMYAVDNAREVSGDLKRLPALVIPYLDPMTGESMSYRLGGGEEAAFIRLRYLKDPPRGFDNVKPQRYAQPANSPVFAYFAHGVGVEWPAVLADKDEPLLLCEGEKKALRACVEGLACIALGGVYNFTRDGALLPELAAIEWKGRGVYICYDSDAATNRDVRLAERRLCAELTRRGADVHIARLPAADDGSKVGLDDFLVAHGREALIELLENALPVDPSAALIVDGTDVEIAEAVLRDLEDAHDSPVVYCEGEFYAYEGTRWRALPAHEVSKAVYTYDRTPCGKQGRVKLSDARTKSIIAVMSNLVTENDFFASAPVGVNCESGFIRFDGDGAPAIEPHDRAHRQRHCLSASWRPGADWQNGSLLMTFLRGCFGEDVDCADRACLVAEICGVAALGIATRLSQPKAIVAFGQSAANGKSELLDMVSRLLPDDAVCSVPPTKFGDERMMVKLVGRKLNTCSELGTAHAIAADVFKSAITGDMVTGRELYRPAVFFQPSALHLFATNALPSFHGGFDRGVQRRLLVLQFNRSIPPEERVANIGSRIAAEEGDALLAFAIDGARRVLRNGGFTEPASSRGALSEWIFSADPVLAWSANRTEYAAGERLATKAAYADFELWAEESGFKKQFLPAANNFVQRLLAQDGRLSNTRTKSERFIVGMRLKRAAGLRRAAGE